MPKIFCKLFEKIKNEAKECADTHIVVVGAGLSGVEIAAEMAYYSNKLLICVDITTITSSLNISWHFW